MPNNETLKDISELKKQTARDEVANAGVEIEKGLAQEEEIARLPEFYFREYFVSALSAPSLPENQNLVAKWIEYAGGPTKPVDIIDADNNVLDRVPPILDTSVLDDERIQSVNFTQVGIVHDRKSQANPAAATEYLGVVIDNVDKRVGDLHTDKRDTMQSILKKYRSNNVDEPTMHEDTIDDDEMEWD